MDFAAIWPSRTDNPFTEVLNKRQKYVASTTLKNPLPWQNSTLLDGDVAAAVARLKESDRDLGVLGSGVLVQTLMRQNLVDEFFLSVYPLILGSGHRLFSEQVPFATLQLVDIVSTTTGVLLATYRPAGEAGGIEELLTQHHSAVDSEDLTRGSTPPDPRTGR